MKRIILVPFALAAVTVVWIAPKIAAQDAQLQLIIQCADFIDSTDVSVSVDHRLVFSQDVKNPGIMPCEVESSTSTTIGQHLVVVRSKKLNQEKRKVVNIRPGRNGLYIYHGTAGKSGKSQFEISETGSGPRRSR